MIKNAWNRNFLTEGKEPKTNSGQSLKEICEKYSMNLCTELLKEDGYFDDSKEQLKTQTIKKKDMLDRKAINAETISLRN